MSFTRNDVFLILHANGSVMFVYVSVSMAMTLRRRALFLRLVTQNNGRKSKN